MYEVSPLFECLGPTLKKDGLGLLLDGLAFIPGEALIPTVVKLGAGAVSVLNSARSGDTLGAFGGIAGFQLTALAPFAKEAGLGALRATPVAGTYVNIAIASVDLFKAGADFVSCYQRFR